MVTLLSAQKKIVQFLLQSGAGKAESMKRGSIVGRHKGFCLLKKDRLRTAASIVLSGYGGDFYPKVSFIFR